MTILRTDIERALDELISNEDGTRFQALAVVLAKQKWPDLIASERKKDGGLDARAPASVANDKKGKGIACSITATVTKVKEDAKNAKDNFPDVEVLIFATPRKVSALKAKKWADDVLKASGHELIVMPREEIITSLMLPKNAALCATLLGIQVPVEEDDAVLLSKVREAVAEIAEQWRMRPRLANRPIVPLNATKLDGGGRELSVSLNPEALRIALRESRRVTLEAPGGGGKTTMLIQIATEIPQPGETAFLIDLPAWIRSGSDKSAAPLRSDDELPRHVSRA